MKQKLNLEFSNIMKSKFSYSSWLVQRYHHNTKCYEIQGTSLHGHLFKVYRPHTLFSKIVK